VERGSHRRGLGVEQGEEGGQLGRKVRHCLLRLE
jgi:hypothetical protein